jgi:hypothetical protein
MGRKRRKENAEKKLKKVTVSILSREHAGKVNKLYQIMERLIAEHHTDLAIAKIVIGWRFEKKEDADGRLWLGSLKKAGDVDRSLHDYDFVMLLNHEFVNSAATDEQITALIDHELCHGRVSKDSHGEIRVDEHGRAVFRTRKHDVEEFREIIARHGAWKSDLMDFFGAWKEAQSRPLLNEDNTPRRRSRRASEPALGPGDSVPDSHLKNGHANGKAKSNGKAAKTEPAEGSLESLGLPYPIIEACHKADLHTIEDVVRFQDEHGAIGIAEISGMGSEKAESLWATVSVYLEHQQTAAAK